MRKGWLTECHSCLPWSSGHPSHTSSDGRLLSPEVAPFFSIRVMPLLHFLSNYYMPSLVFCTGDLETYKTLNCFTLAPG